MKNYYLLILLLCLSAQSFAKGEPKTEKVAIDMTLPVYTYTQELEKQTDNFSVELTFDGNATGITASYILQREAHQPLTGIVAASSTVNGFRAGTYVSIPLTFKNLIPGDVYLIKIKFFDPAERTIDVKVTIPARGFWAVAYGNNFIINSTFKENGHYDYFLKQGAPGTYTISDKKGNGLSYAPSVNFTYLKYTKYDLGWAYGFSLGLETNSVTPTVSAGFGAHFNYKVQILAGIALHQMPSLRPEYNVGETVASLLSADQLTRNTYRGDLFFSLNFRFDKNPRE